MFSKQDGLINYLPLLTTISNAPTTIREIPRRDPETSFTSPRTTKPVIVENESKVIIDPKIKNAKPMYLIIMSFEWSGR
jgi:hypothetical protein